MPFKSQAQKARCLKMLERGEITQETFDKWNEGTPEELPERLSIKPRMVKEVKIEKPIKPQEID